MTALKLNISGFLFQIPLIIILISHQQTPFRCRSHAKTSNLSTRVGVKQTTIPDETIHLLKAILGPSSKWRKLLEMLPSARSISQRRVNSGTILVEIRRKQGLNLQRILRSLEIIQKLTSWTHSQEQRRQLYHATPTPLHILRKLATPLQMSQEHQAGLLCLPRTNQRSHTHTSLATLVIHIVLINKLTALNKASCSNLLLAFLLAFLTALALILDTKQLNRIVQISIPGLPLVAL